MQPMTIIGQPRYDRPYQRTSFEIERLARLRGGDAQVFLVALCFRQVGEVDQPQPEAEIGMDDGARFSAAQIEGRAPDLVPSQELVQAALERLEIERAVAVDGYRFIVERHIRRHRSMKPHIALLGRERHRLSGAPRLDSVAGTPVTTGIAVQQLMEKLALLIGQCRRLFHGDGRRSNDTGREVRPRSPRFCRHTNGTGSSLTPGRRRRSVENATWPSMRARGAPKQK